MCRENLLLTFTLAFLTNLTQSPAPAQTAVRGDVVFTMAGEPIRDGVVLVENGKIKAVGPQATTPIPDGYQVIEAPVVTPGLIDAHATAGLTGIYNQPQDQDHQDPTAPIQPELRALDAVNMQEKLIAYLRGFGITTIHTGHSSGPLVSGQTLIVKTTGDTVEGAMLRELAAISATIGPAAVRREGSPGTRGKQMAMLRQELIKAREYSAKRQDPPGTSNSGKDGQETTPVARDLRLDALADVLEGKVPLLITVNKAQDIATALRLAEEFSIQIWLDGAAEAYLLIDKITASGVPVILHPTMTRATGEYENLSFETAGKLVDAGILVALQSGYEGYVPKVRVVLFEAAITAANGLSFEQALATITIDAARLLGIADRVGSLEVGKDADIALYDGDPFEYTTQCIGVLVNGQLTDQTPR